MPTIGRNQPCPCGSGAKYKRCCLGGPDPRDESTVSVSAAVLKTPAPSADRCREPITRSAATLLDRVGRELEVVPRLEVDGGTERYDELLSRVHDDPTGELEVRLTTLTTWTENSPAHPDDPATWVLDPDATVTEMSCRAVPPEQKEEALRRLMAMAESEEAVFSTFPALD